MWNQLLRERRAYWVDRIDYSPVACRFLLTKRKFRKNIREKLIPYDPAKEDGPWWHDQEKDVHYRNGDITLEFMVDDSLEISECESIKFVDHHKHQCCIDPGSCPDKGLYSGDAGARFLAGCLERNIVLPRKSIANENDKVANGHIDSAIRGLCVLFDELDDEDYLCKMGIDDQNAIEIARVMVSCLVSDNRYAAGLSLAKLFGSKKDLKKILFTLAEKHLGVNLKTR